ncbi:MAG TPA: hypothetical protein DCM37_07615 [Brucella melitensis]|nr:hypothetical protein CUC12_04095 [Brucella melitensis]EEW86411.1 predicted protein [Brucella melitensis bv. 1 str. 16M]HAJ68237.1 hypothetical protein [Brucella melitensis]HAK20016.1 hypothetical protein [Brucella melitensis]HCZ29489.1 hypothetical protein [Brucella melitensis]
MRNPLPVLSNGLFKERRAEWLRFSCHLAGFPKRRDGGGGRLACQSRACSKSCSVWLQTALFCVLPRTYLLYAPLRYSKITIFAHTYRFLIQAPDAFEKAWSGKIYSKGKRRVCSSLNARTLNKVPI